MRLLFVQTHYCSSPLFSSIMSLSAVNDLIKEKITREDVGEIKQWLWGNRYERTAEHWQRGAAWTKRKRGIKNKWGRDFGREEESLTLGEECYVKTLMVRAYRAHNKPVIKKTPNNLAFAFRVASSQSGWKQILSNALQFLLLQSCQCMHTPPKKIIIYSLLLAHDDLWRFIIHLERHYLITGTQKRSINQHEKSYMKS